MLEHEILMPAADMKPADAADVPNNPAYCPPRFRMPDVAAHVGRARTAARSAP